MGRMLFCSGTGWPFRTAVLFMLLLGLAVPSASTLAMGDRPDADTPLEAGRVLTARGEVIARQPGGEARALTRGDHVYEGDTLLTGDGGRAQIRFIDQGLVQLQPRTEFVIEHYRETEGEEGAMTRLVEGGLRALSGSIGQRDREHYRLDTPVASIGIRGTHYALNHCAADCAPGLEGTVGGVISGRIAVNNDAGEREFGRNQFFSVPDRNTPPRRLSQPPAGLLDATDADDATYADEGDEDDPTAVSDSGDSGPFGSGTEDFRPIYDDDSGIGSIDDDDSGTDSIGDEDSGTNSIENFILDGEPFGLMSEGFNTIDESSTIETDTSLGIPVATRMTMDGWSGEVSILDGTSIEDLKELGYYDTLGVSWGRWDKADYEYVTWDDEPAGDWYWIMVDDLSRLTEDVSGLGHLGTQTFSWYGGTSSVAVDHFTLDADFSAMKFTSGLASFGGGAHVYDQLRGDLDGIYTSSLMVLESDGNMQLEFWYYMLGTDADGMMITFSESDGTSTTGNLNGTGLLTR